MAVVVGVLNVSLQGLGTENRVSAGIAPDGTLGVTSIGDSIEREDTVNWSTEKLELETR